MWRATVWAGRKTLVHRRRGVPPPFLLQRYKRMNRQLSIFIDESGDFGAYQPHSPHYLVAMLFHDQRNDIGHATQLLDNQIKHLGFEPHALHTGPIIRREGIYINRTIDERKKLLNTLIHFCRRVEVQYTILHVDKRECADIIELTARIFKQIRAFVDRHNPFFRLYDEIIVYYDNGQIELTQILTSTLSVLLPTRRVFDLIIRPVFPNVCDPVTIGVCG